jgi:hypothetical protein
MGHLTRQAAVALALRSPHRATLFSLSLGLPHVLGLGLQGEYCPSYDRPWIASREWHRYLCDRLVAIIDETGADAVLFDGVAPYPGIYRASRQRRGIPFIWLRRGMWQKGANTAALDKTAYFDLVIEPGDLGSEGDEGPTAGRGDAVETGPISILEPLEMKTRKQAREELALPPDGPIALLTLGSGRLGDVAGPGAAALASLLENTPEWHVAVTRSPVALNEIPLDQADRVTELSGVYPLAAYLPAFDAAISSAGYNAVHELIPAGLPSLLVANTSTRTDDQVARARSLERQELALAALDTDPDSVAAACGQLVAERSRLRLAERAENVMSVMTGASEVGAIVSGSPDGFEPRKRTLGELIATARIETKERVKDMLGPEGTETVKRLLGRGEKAHHGRSRVNLVFSADQTSDDALDLVMAESVTGELLAADHPVEHVLPGSSPGYASRRREIVDHYYDVIEGPD